MTITPIDTDYRVQLPADWSLDLGLRGIVVLERTNEGILVRPCPCATWDEVSAAKLIIGSAPPDPHEDTIDTNGDDFLF
jgi:hypothetical protein